MEPGYEGVPAAAVVDTNRWVAWFLCRIKRFK